MVTVNIHNAEFARNRAGTAQIDRIGLTAGLVGFDRATAAGTARADDLAVPFHVNDHEQVTIADECVAGSLGHDTAATDTITVDDPSANGTLGISSGAEEPTGNEPYVFDDVSAVAG